MRLRHLPVVVPALMLVVACGRHRDNDAEQKDVPVGLSRGAASADVPLQAGDVRIVSADSGVDLALIGDTISGGLSARTLAKVRHDTDTGAVTGDLSSRRGQLEGQISRGGTQIITASVPLSNMFGYSTELRSRTQGRATYSMHFEKYAEAPRNVSEEVVAKVMGKVEK